MKNITIFSLLLLLFSSISLVSASPVITNITPNITLQYNTTTYFANVSDTINLTYVNFYFNSSLISSQNVTGESIQNQTFNFTYQSNSSGLYNLTVIAIDENNNTTSTLSVINVTAYISPSISNIAPINATENIQIILQATGQQGSYPIQNVTWGFPGGIYLTDIALIGANYQSYIFNNSGTFQVTAEICDVNNFCTQTQQNIYVASTNPSSYWTVNPTLSTATINLIFGNPEQVYLYYQPYNDTSPVAEAILNWGDGYSDTDIYSNAVTSQNFTHYYGLTPSAIGNYSLSVDICDVQGNCHTTFLTNITYSQNIVKSVAGALLSTQPISLSQQFQSAFTPYYNWWVLNAGNTWGFIGFWGSIIIPFLIIMWFMITLIAGYAEQLGKNTANKGRFGRGRR